jgi:hypothetical protein
MRKTQRTKKQHFVPQFYLAGFSADGRHVYAFDKIDGRVFLASFKDVAQEAYFYDYQPGTFQADDPTVPFDHQQVEKILSQIEGNAATIMRNLFDRVEAYGMTADDILEFAPYVALQWMRTKEYRECLVALANANSQAIANDLVKKNWPELPEHEYPTVTLDPRCSAALHNEHFFDERSIFIVAKHLEDHFWVVGINKTGQPFYTSDNPVVRRANCSDGDIPLIGLCDRGVEFAFPLNSRQMLLILEREHFASFRKHDGQCIDLTPEQVADYNRLQVLKSHRQVYAQTPDFDLAKAVRADRPDLCQLDRPRVKVELIEVEPLKSRIVLQVLD